MTNPTRFGKYDLLALLATGGMAEIWLARVSRESVMSMAMDWTTSSSLRRTARSSLTLIKTAYSRLTARIAASFI